jgi:hypothetical protein
MSALSTPNGGEGYNSYTDLNPNTITSKLLQCIPAASPHLANKTTSKPQAKYCMLLNLLFIKIHTVPTYEINIQKEWHWPPII